MTEPNQTPPRPAARHDFALALVLLWLSGAALWATILAVPPVLPRVTADFGLNATDVGLLIGLPPLLFALVALPSAVLIARFGAVSTLVAGLLLNALGAAARGFAGSALGLDATTALMCLGVAVMQPALPPLVRPGCRVVSASRPQGPLFTGVVESQGWRARHAMLCCLCSTSASSKVRSQQPYGDRLMPDDVGSSLSNLQVQSIESRASWFAAGVTLAILSVAYGSTLLIVVGLRVMELDLGVSRSTLALAGALTWVGTGLGGIVMGWLSDRIGVRNSVMMGAVMIALGLGLASIGSIWALYIGQGVLIGFLGMGAIYPPLLIYVSRWFDRRRGTAIALISSGQYIAGVMWPAVFERVMAGPGWRIMYLAFAGVVLLGVVPLAALFLRPAPGMGGAAARTAEARHVAPARVLGLRPKTVQALLCIAGFCCCVPMAIPQAHLVAFCGDIGIGAATGAMMLSVLLGCAFISRQFWGVFADRHGGLKTILAGSAFQAVSVGAFLLTQNEAGLFVVAAAYGFGFSGIIPAYVVTIRDLFPSAEASWRIPLVLFTSMSGMAFGSWFAGRLYDHFGFYAPAFGSGVVFNVINLMLLGSLVLRQPKSGRSINAHVAV